MALEEEARLLRAGVRAGLLDPDKGTAALVVFSELKQRGAGFSFGAFLVERGLLTQMALGGLERSIEEDGGESLRTVSTVDQFELLDLLGEGASGSVFRARHLPTGRLVALKILAPDLAASPEALEQFLQAARASIRLRHPNLVQVQRVACFEGLYYMAMELVEGGSARKLLERSGGMLTEIRALALAADVAAALAAAHQAGLVHRDVNPDNVLLTADGIGKLTDLGIAVHREVEGGMDLDRGEFWGTPDYTAPEVVAGEGANDPRSDLYSLGCMLHEFLTGRPPFLAATPVETLRMQLFEPVPEITHLRPDLSPQTATLVTRLLAKDPKERFPDAASVLEAIGVIGSLRRAASASALPRVPASPTPSGSRAQAVPRPSARAGGSGIRPARRGGSGRGARRGRGRRK
ncbi:MAG: serine/threonine protein kinase [Planctomycetota bacterium]|nr:serine/threonine protein kinase [Planctomycetota bacterium]